MCRHEDKICPRCQAVFECKVGSILQCQCTGVVLNGEQQQSIVKQYNDCLCLKCIIDLRNDYNKSLTDNQLDKNS